MKKRVIHLLLMKKENCLKQNINLPQMLHLLLEKTVFRKQKKILVAHLKI